ncbi:MAG: TetR/AcrR family transcriptional regulator [Acidimicrobiia bacterium]
MEPQQRPGGRTARVRANVLEATLNELGASGWGALSIERIAERSGVHKTTIYRRWGTVDRLALEALLDRGSEEIPVPDTGGLVGDLLALGRLIAAAISDPVGRALTTAIVVEPDSQTLSRIADVFWSERFGAARVIVERGIERGEVARSVDVDQVIESIASQIWFRTMVRRETVTDPWLRGVIDAAVRSTP